MTGNTLGFLQFPWQQCCQNWCGAHVLNLVGGFLGNRPPFFQDSMLPIYGAKVSWESRLDFSSDYYITYRHSVVMVQLRILLLVYYDGVSCLDVGGATPYAIVIVWLQWSKRVRLFRIAWYDTTEDRLSRGRYGTPLVCQRIFSSSCGDSKEPVPA